MGCVQSLAKEEKGNSGYTQKGAVYVFVPGLRAPSRTKEVAKALNGLVSSKLVEHLADLRTRIEVMASGEGLSGPPAQQRLQSKRKGMAVQQGSQSHVFCGGTTIADLQGALEDYLPVLLGLANDEKLREGVEFCWINQEDPQQETCIMDIHYELLSVLHLMAVLALSQANILLTPKPPADGYQPKITEENKRAAIEAFLKAAGMLKHAMSTTMAQMPGDVIKMLPADLTEGILNALAMQALGQGVEIQLSFSLDNSKATLAVKRRLACEQMKCWKQVNESIQTVHVGNTWGPKHNLFVKWKLAEAKAAAYYFHGLILDEGTDKNRHAKSLSCLQLAESSLTESKKFCAQFCASSPATRVSPLWGAMKYLSEKIPKDAASKARKYDDAANLQKVQKVPDLPDFSVALQPDSYSLPALDSAWSAEMLNASYEDQQLRQHPLKQ